MRDFLALKENCSAIQLAEIAQRLWNKRHGIRHRLTTSHQHSQDPGDCYPRGQKTNPHYRQNPRVCQFQTFDISITAFQGIVRDCVTLGNAQRAHLFQGLECHRCRQEGHTARNCPVLHGQGSSVASFSGGIRNQRGSIDERGNPNA